MPSTKKRRKKKCLKCGVSLSLNNWATYDQKRAYYICKPCRKKVDEKSHRADSDYAKKQKNRYRMRRSAVILAYGNACVTCGEDDYTKLTINGNINHLYDSIVQKSGHHVTCYNCSKTPSNNKYALKYRKQLVRLHGGCCQMCPEERAERLTITPDKKLLCYNCYMSQLAADKFAIEHPEAEKQPG